MIRPWLKCILPVLLLLGAGAVSATERVEPSVAPAADSLGASSGRKVRADLQLLVDRGIESLAPELVAHGTFYPFAAVLGFDQEVRLVGVSAAERNAPPEAVLQALVDKIRQLAQERRIRAAAYFMDFSARRVDTGVTQPGIRVELHHRQADAMSAFIPYSITPDNQLRLLTPQYKAGNNLTFTSP